MLTILSWRAPAADAQPPPAPAQPTPAAPQIEWLLTADGERRGLAIRSDLASDAGLWELWANGAGSPPLAPLNELVAREPGKSAIEIAINGGYWNEFDHPVGVCGGERGITGSASHANGFAIAGGRAWIGPLGMRSELTPQALDEPAPRYRNLPINPRPIPARLPCLLDPRAYPWPIAPPGPATVCWLASATSETSTLRFNREQALRIERVIHWSGEAPLETPPATTIVLLIPGTKRDREGEAPLPRVGDRYRLILSLTGCEGEVRLVTCAGPRLLRDGQVVQGLDGQRSPRTAVGCDAAGRQLTLILLARGAQGEPGATLEDAAKVLQQLGATQAINLDGGSSTSAFCPRLAPELQVLFPLQWPIHHALVLRNRLTKNPSQP